MPNRGRLQEIKRFERAVGPWMEDLRRLAMRLTGSVDDTEDLLQDLWIRLQPRLDEVEELDHPRPWLARVLYRMFVDRWRRDQAGPVRDEGVDLDDAVATGDLPDEAFERGMRRDRLQAALDGLPSFQRELVILHDVEGYTLTEISEITGTPTGTLKSRLHRARNSLRILLSSEE